MNTLFSRTPDSEASATIVLTVALPPSFVFWFIYIYIYTARASFFVLYFSHVTAPISPLPHPIATSL